MPTGRKRAALVQQVNHLKWVHRIDLGHGLVTPGLWGTHPFITRAFEEIDFRGKKVLDIGCWVGLYAFEAEKRGAALVHATDLVTQRDFRGHATFHLARRILGSKARYTPDLSVYDVERLGVADFDVVIYAGVYYHLKDPLRSFAALRRVMNEGGILLAEGAVLAGEECHARYFYRETYLKDKSNWWIPTLPCLAQWVESNFFEVTKSYDVWNAGGGNLRGTVLARAVRRADPLYLRPDEDLRAYDLNDYSAGATNPPGRSRAGAAFRTFAARCRDRIFAGRA